MMRRGGPAMMRVDRAAAPAASPAPGKRRRQRRRSTALIVGGAMLATIALLALLAPVIAPYSPTAQNLLAGLQPPTPEHWLGTDQLGRDVLSRMLFAGRTALGVAMVAALAPFVIGVTVGLVAGYFGRAVDWALSRVVDTVIAFPFYVIVIALVFAVGAGEVGIVVAFALVGWVGYARVVRLLTASLREVGWVRAARGGGLSHARVLWRHLLPNVLPQAVVLFMTEVLLIMVAIVTLGYLGLGIQPPTPDWGTMIADAQPFVTSHWWLAVAPGLAVVVTGVALSLVGDGLGDVMRVGGLAVPARAATSSTVTRARPSSPSQSPATPGPTSAPAATSALPSAPAPEQGAHADAPIPVRRGEVRIRGLRIEVASGSRRITPHPNARGHHTPAALVDGVDLAVAPGEALGIVGESGSGKSLTLRAALGLLPAGTKLTAGHIAVGGPLGMVFQDPLTALDPLERVGAQVGEAIHAAHPDWIRDRVRERTLELLTLVRLDDAERRARAYPHELSGGQRQRVVIAIALAGDPAVLLCDEPTTALDVTVQREVLDMLDELRRERGLTLLFVSHDLAVVAQVCSTIVVMRAGRIIERGSATQVAHNPGSAYTRALLSAVPRLPALVDQPQLPPNPDTHAHTPAPGATPNRLDAADITVRFGRRTALDAVSIAVPAGHALGIVGESGSGKTTLARVLAGQLGAASGTVRLDGAPIHRNKATLRRVQLIPQDPASSLNPRMTVGQLLGELLRVHRVVSRAGGSRRAPLAAAVAGLLEQVQLDPGLARALPHELSGGQRQRVAIARALAVQPDVLIADEPTSALDVTVQAGIIALLTRLRAELGLTVVLISHDLAVVHAACDRVVVMRDGRVVERGGREVFTNPVQPYTRELLTAVPRLVSPGVGPAR